MLVLKRMKGERVIIGDGPNKVTVVVTEVGRYFVRLGVEAPKEIPVHREEVYDAIQAAARPSGASESGAGNVGSHGPAGGTTGAEAG